MTPNELLNLVKTQFQVLYVESGKLTNLLKQALGTYQDRAGVIRKLQFGDDDTEADTPADLLEVICVADAEGRWHEHRIDGDTITVIEQLRPGLSIRKSVRPYTVSYFVNLRDMDIEKDVLPPETVGPLREYLEALIAIPNTARARQIATATGIQAEYPSDDELRTRKENLELAMEDLQAIIPMATVY
jgi:hypothetical protein